MSLRAMHIAQLTLTLGVDVVSLSSSPGEDADLRSEWLVARSAAANASCSERNEGDVEVLIWSNVDRVGCRWELCTAL